MKTLSISDYTQSISLDQVYTPSAEPMIFKDDKALTHALLAELQHVLSHLGIEEYSHLSISDQRDLLDAAITILPPNSLSSLGIKQLDQLLQNEIKKREITDAKVLAKMPFFKIPKNGTTSTKVLLWRGDITTLKVDAIVNAANNQMLGCFQPMHKCIDNAIHNRAGVQLRNDCQTIMEQQGFNEPSGITKVTRAYNLPSDYVIHTVGPIVNDKVSQNDKALLTSCYNSILNVSKSVNSIKSIALCAISTGVFGYPIDEATPVAIETVIKWIKNNPKQLDIVIFNVFSKKDHDIYQSILENMEF